MRKIYIILLIVLLASCTQNDGHIGPIFGKWQLREIKEGETCKNVNNIFYSFQNNIIATSYVFESTKTLIVYGVFQIKDDSLYIQMSENTNPFIDFGLPHDTTSFQISIHHNKMILERNQKRLTFRKY